MVSPSQVPIRITLDGPYSYPAMCKKNQFSGCLGEMPREGETAEIRTSTTFVCVRSLDAIFVPTAFIDQSLQVIRMPESKSDHLYHEEQEWSSQLGGGMSPYAL